LALTSMKPTVMKNSFKTPRHMRAVSQPMKKRSCSMHMLVAILIVTTLSSMGVNGQLVNVQFGDAGNPYIKTGPEQVGSIGDFWNFITTDKGGGSFSLSPALDSFGVSTSINITSGGDTVAVTSHSGSDNLFNGFLDSSGGDDFQIYVDLPAGTYDLYLYNHSGYSTTFTLSLDGSQIDSGSTSSTFVHFSGITLNSPGTLTINCSSSAEPVCNGLQISSSFSSCPTPSSHPTITWSGHSSTREGAHDTANRAIWCLHHNDGAEVVSTDSNSAIGFVDTSSEAASDQYFYSASTVGKMLLLACASTENTSRLTFWDASSYTKLGSRLGTIVNVDLDPRHKLGYSKARKTAYVAGFNGAPATATAALSIVDCDGQTVTANPTFTGIGAGFGYCVFAENADKLIIENWTGSGSSPFWYYSPGSGTLSGSSCVSGLAAIAYTFYVDELGVIVMKIGTSVYVIDPTTDSVVANLGNLGDSGSSGTPVGVCYNTCSGLLYIAVVVGTDSYVKKFNPASSYSHVGTDAESLSPNFSHLYFDPYSNLVYSQFSGASQINTY